MAEIETRAKTDPWSAAWFLKLLRFFFTPIPYTYTSSPLDGMAKNYFLFSTWIRKIMQFN